MYLFQFLVWFLSLFLHILARNVDVDIVANWPQYSTSFIVQVGELLSEQQLLPRLKSSQNKVSPFWSYLDFLCEVKSNSIDDILRLSAKNSLNDSSSSFKSELKEDFVSSLNQEALEKAFQLIPPSLHSLSETMLSMTYYSPSVQFYDSLASRYYETSRLKQCSSSLPSSSVGSAFIVTVEGNLDGEVVFCHLNDELLSKVSPSISPGQLDEEDQIFDWDHVYPSSGSMPTSSEIDRSSVSSSSSSSFILYGVYGSSSFCSLYSKAKDAVKKGTLSRFAVRPAFGHVSDPLSPDLSLQGYGIFLDIKNMEYKNVDDAAASSLSSSSNEDSSSSSADTSSSPFSEDEEIEGINFYKLFQRNPSLREEIMILRDNLKEKQASSPSTGEDHHSSRKSDASMKVWKMKDFGFQLLQLISSIAMKGGEGSSSSFFALQKAKEFVNNFPRFAPLISSTKVSSSIRNDLSSWFSHPISSMIPVNTLFLNNQPIALGGNTFNIYDVLSSLKKEIDVINQMKLLNTSVSITNLLKKVLSGATDDDAEEGDGGRGNDPLRGMMGMMGGGMGGGGGGIEEKIMSDEKLSMEERQKALVAHYEKDIVRIDISKGSLFSCFLICASLFLVSFLRFSFF
jgi:hypothetical protein